MLQGGTMFFFFNLKNIIQTLLTFNKIDAYV